MCLKKVSTYCTKIKIEQNKLLKWSKDQTNGFIRNYGVRDPFALREMNFKEVSIIKHIGNFHFV